MSSINLHEKILIAVLVAGLGLSLYLIYYHYELEAGQNGWCDLGGVVNCTNLILSEYSQIGGVPLGFFGSLWFVIALIIKLSDKISLIPDSFKDNSKLFLVLWCVIGMSFVLYLVFVEFLLKSIFILCTAVHIMVLFAFILAFLDLRKSGY